jgi:hypothetical protein
MSPEASGIAGIVALLVLFLLRVPIAFALMIVGFGGFAALSGTAPALALLSQDLFDTFTSYPLSVIPMFILMGAFAYSPPGSASGCSRPPTRGWAVCAAGSPWPPCSPAPGSPRSAVPPQRPRQRWAKSRCPR